jgi:hypothetical protein
MVLRPSQPSHAGVASPRIQARLLDVHVVELAREGVDLPAAGCRIEHSDLVLEAAPLDHAGLAHQLKVAVDIPSE